MKQPSQSLAQNMTPSDHESCLQQIEGLMAKNELTPAENTQLSALADAAGQYEDKHFPIQPPLHPADARKELQCG